jgi:exopolysaccharide biosynthesis polyprenyl glycosylphosphotransferase
MDSSAAEELSVGGAGLVERPLDIPRGPQVGSAAAVKRSLDIAIALIAVVVLLPVLILVSIAILLESRGPLFFTQERVGQGGKVFTVFKFRSMTRDAERRLDEVRGNNEVVDGPTFKWRADTRTTRVGRFLRRTSLDELPQLFNVLLGDMSLVGPRPPLETEVVMYESWQLERLAVRPGMTGLWQVSGRSDLSFSEMVELDLRYVRSWSVWLDILLLLRTPLAVVTCRGAY